MTDFDIDGCWQGEYTYDFNEAFPDLPPVVRFTLTARRGRSRSFEGLIQDDRERGVPEPASVRGQIRGRGLIFTKCYPNVFVFCNGRSVPLPVYMRSEYGLQLDEAVPGPPISYEGAYDFTQQTLSGTWRYGPELIQVSCGGQRYDMDFPLTSGRWTARRSPS